MWFGLSCPELSFRPRSRTSRRIVMSGDETILQTRWSVVPILDTFTIPICLRISTRRFLWSSTRMSTSRSSSKSTTIGPPRIISTVRGDRSSMLPSELWFELPTTIFSRIRFELGSLTTSSKTRSSRWVRCSRAIVPSEQWPRGDVRSGDTLVQTASVITTIKVDSSTKETLLALARAIWIDKPEFSIITRSMIRIKGTDTSKVIRTSSPSLKWSDESNEGTLWMPKSTLTNQGCSMSRLRPWPSCPQLSSTKSFISHSLDGCRIPF